MKRTFGEIQTTSDKDNEQQQQQQQRQRIDDDDDDKEEEEDDDDDLMEYNPTSCNNQRVKPGRKAYTLSSYKRANIIRELQECDFNDPVHIVSSINNFLYKNVPEDEEKVLKWSDETDRLFRLHLNQWLKDNKDDFYIKCWGIFSLGIPGKTGQSCSEHYRTILRRRAYFLTSQENQRGKRLSKQECQKVLTTFNFKGPADIYFSNIPSHPTIIKQKQSISDESLPFIHPTDQASSSSSGVEYSTVLPLKQRISEDTISYDKAVKLPSKELKESKHSPSCEGEHTDYIDSMISNVLKLPIQQESEKAISRISLNQNEKGKRENLIPRDLNQMEKNQVHVNKRNLSTPPILQHKIRTSQAAKIDSHEQIVESTKKTHSEDDALHREQQIAVANIPATLATDRFAPSATSSINLNENTAITGVRGESSPIQKHPFYSRNSVFKQSLPPSSHDTGFHPSSHLANQAVRNILKQESTTSTVLYPTRIGDWTVDKVVEYLKKQCNVSNEVAKYARDIGLNGERVIYLCEGGDMFNILQNSPLSMEVLLRIYGFIMQRSQQ